MPALLKKEYVEEEPEVEQVEKKKKKKKHTEEVDDQEEQHETKEKSKSKRRQREEESSAMETDEPVEPSEKKKKRKKESDDEEEEESSKKHKSKKSKRKESSSEEEAEEEKEESPYALSRFPISAKTVANLKARGVVELFPIQAQTFVPIFEGKDVVGQARTGSGKTLSFSLPIIEKMLKEPRQGRGRGPVLIVMAPTRELAKQIEKEILSIAEGQPIATSCIYGGAPYEQQEAEFRAGIDVLVGTPGRIQDHINRGNLKLSAVKYVVLDECDRMLEVGFAEAVDEILANLYANEDQRPQTLLFSATMPRWVQDTARKYLRKDKITIDLVGDDRKKTSHTIDHLAIVCPYAERANTIRDVVQVYSGAYGRTIIFTSTKKEANELGLGALAKHECQVLHGDIAQAQRELTLQQFRDGKIKVLVATDVAARGIDIPEVDLVIQTEPPERVDDYIHRSGRTGRAGKHGTCILFYKLQQEYLVRNIEQRTGTTFKRVGAPQPADIVKASSKDSIRALSEVPKSIIPLFKDAAASLMAEQDPVEALAAALAHIAGHRQEIQARSLLSSAAGFTTYIMTMQTPIRTASYIWTILERVFPPELKAEARGMRLTADKCAGVFDVPSKFDSMIKEMWQDTKTTTLAVCTELPELELKDPITTQSPRRPWMNGRSNSGGHRGGARPFGRGGFGRGGNGFRNGR